MAELLVEQESSYVETTEIQDKAILGKITKVVSIRDPVDNKLIVKVRNPSVPIKSYANPEKAKIDLNKSITDGENNPPINSEPHLRYTE